MPESDAVEEFFAESKASPPMWLRHTFVFQNAAVYRVEKSHKRFYEMWKPGQEIIQDCGDSIRISLMGLDELIWNLATVSDIQKRHC